jgi:hypothetical protein
MTHLVKYFIQFVLVSVGFFIVGTTTFFIFNDGRISYGKFMEEFALGTGLFFVLFLTTYISIYILLFIYRLIMSKFFSN